MLIFSVFREYYKEEIKKLNKKETYYFSILERLEIQTQQFIGSSR